MRRVSSGTTRVGNASPRPQVSDARRVLRRFPPACCRTSDETPRDSATEESEVRRMDEERTERASPGATGESVSGRRKRDWRASDRRKRKRSEEARLASQRPEKA